MADAITIKALQDASLDAKSLEEVVNGGEEKQVTTRKGETYPSVKKAIKTMFQNGGLPATPFATKALMEASALVDGDYAMVTDDTVNNGLYVKTAGAWVKSGYDPLTQSKDYVDSNPLFKPTVIHEQNIDTLKTAGIYIQRAVGVNLTTIGYPVHREGILRVESSPASAFAVQTYYDAVNRITYSRWFGSSWSEWGSSRDFLETVNANPKYKAQALKASDNLDDITVSGEYHKIS